MPAPYPGPAYRIITERLVVRCYNPADAQLLKDSIDESASARLEAYDVYNRKLL